MRCWKSESAQELRASPVRRSKAYGYCGYRELRSKGVGPLAVGRVTIRRSVKRCIESTADIRRRTDLEHRRRTRVAGGLPSVTTTWDTARCGLATEVGDDHRSLNAGKATTTTTCSARTER
jgi:hypothetical protein